LSAEKPQWSLSLFSGTMRQPNNSKIPGTHRLMINLGGESLVANRPVWTKVRQPQGLLNTSEYGTEAYN